MVGFKTLLTGATFLASALAETHTFNWTTGWGTANLDGVLERPVITCNGQFPWPDIQVKTGDRIELYLTNGFDDRNTTLHFHGFFQEGTNQMDGPEMITQCPIGVGQTYLYNFTVTQTGSYWYHSHSKTQYLDGMRGAVIIHNDDYPYKKGQDYDEETLLTFTEWYHETGDEILPKFMTVFNPTGAEPIPQNFLMNNTRNSTFEVKPDTTYLIRLINMGGFTSYYFYIEDHEFDVIEVDGVQVERNTTDMLYIAVAQRYTILLKTKNDTSRNYAIMQAVDQDMLDTIPADLVLNGTATLSYDSNNEAPEQYYVDSFEDDAYLDDFFLVPIEKEELLPEPDHIVTVDVKMDNLMNGINYAFFNNITYTAPKTPILLTALAAGDLATNELVYGTNTHSIVLQKDEIVQVVLNNLDTGKHPFHLHGHVFQAIARGPTVDEGDPVPFDADDHEEYPEYPMRRDTFNVKKQSNFVIRFKAENPGIWMFHCHVDWHLVQGLAVVFVEAPLEIQNTPSQQMTENHKAICANVGINPLTNAAGNTNFMDLTGENVQAKDIPSGFTAKGIVAFVFSCIAAVLGMIAIAIYGLSDVKDLEKKVADDLGVDLDEVSRDEDEEQLSNGDGSSSNERKEIN